MFVGIIDPIDTEVESPEMNRRRFLQRTSILSGGLALALPEITSEQELTSSSWRSFEVTTRIEILKPAGVTRVWAPVALLQETPFQKTIANSLHCHAATARIVESARGLNLIAAEFAPGVKPGLTLTTQVETRNWAVDFSTPGKPKRATESELSAYLQPTRMLPIDGIVKKRATEITKGAKTDVDKARAIYEWIVENTYRDRKSVV